MADRIIAKRKSMFILYLICGLFAGLIIGFSLNYNRTVYIPNHTGTNWKGYKSGSLEINVLTEPENRSSHGTASLHSGINNHYTANDLVIPDVIRLKNKLYDLVQIDENAFYIGDDGYNLALSGSLTIGNNVQTIGSRAFASCKNLNKELIINDKLTQIASYAFWYCNFNNSNFTIGKNINVGDIAFLGNDFPQLTFCENIVIGNLAFGLSSYLGEIICDGWSSLPTDWGTDIFTLSKANGYVRSINSNLSSTAVLEFLQTHGLSTTWQAA